MLHSAVGWLLDNFDYIRQKPILFTSAQSFIAQSVSWGRFPHRTILCVHKELYYVRISLQNLVQSPGVYYVR